MSEQIKNCLKIVLHLKNLKSKKTFVLKNNLLQYQILLYQHNLQGIKFLQGKISVPKATGVFRKRTNLERFRVCRLGDKILLYFKNSS